mmetsp:Transcript_79698/g.215516  ORF Transcript_79698/g.215516 Transcript_79698/m.215516 type:complete len:268 (+) Transcript_79698:297-1100(+)
MCRRTRPLTLYALPLSGLTANAAVASLAAALAFFIFINSSARFEIIIAVGAPTMMASVSLARAAALSPSSSNSADSPCNLFRRSICSSVSSLFIASPSGIGSPASSSAAPAQISSSSDRGSMTFSSTLGCSTGAPTSSASLSSSFSLSLSSSSSSSVTIVFFSLPFAKSEDARFWYSGGCSSIENRFFQAPLYSSHCPMSGMPLNPARCWGVQPSVSSLFSDAFFSTSNTTMESRPASTARKSGEWPKLSSGSIGWPFSRNISTKFW